MGLIKRFLNLIISGKCFTGLTNYDVPSFSVPWGFEYCGISLVNTFLFDSFPFKTPNKSTLALPFSLSEGWMCFRTNKSSLDEDETSSPRVILTFSRVFEWVYPSFALVQITILTQKPVFTFSRVNLLKIARLPIDGWNSPFGFKFLWRTHEFIYI